MEKLDCRVHGQSHSKISKCQWMFVWITEPFTTKLCMVMRQHEPECSAKRFLCCLQGQGHSGGLILSKYDFLLYSLRCWSFCNQSLVWLHIIISLVVLWKDCITVLCWRSVSQQRFQISLNFHLDHMVSTAEPFVIKLWIVMHHHRPECYVKRLVWYLKSQGHSEGLWLDMTVELVCSFFQPNLIGLRIIIFWSVLRKNYYVQGQGHREGSNFHWIFVYLMFTVPLISWQPN